MVTTNYEGRASTVTLAAGSQFEINAPEKLADLAIVHQGLLRNTTIKAYDQLQAALRQAQTQKKHLLLDITRSSSWSTPLSVTFTFAERCKSVNDDRRTLDDLFPVAKAARAAGQEKIFPLSLFEFHPTPNPRGFRGTVHPAEGSVCKITQARSYVRALPRSIGTSGWYAC